MKIAILVNGKNKVMGRFSKPYIEKLPYEKVVFFGGLIPVFKEGTPSWKQKMILYWIALISLNNPYLIEKNKIRRLSRLLKKEKIDIALFEFLNTAASSFLACKKLNVPVLSNVLGYEINQNSVVEHFSKKYRELALYGTRVVPVAKDMITKLKRLGFGEDQITYSPIGPSKDFFNIQPNYDSKQFLAIGRFCETKAPDLTILAFNEVVKKYANARLVMAGSGELLNKCMNLVNQLGISSNVNFVGWIDEKEQKQYLADSFCFVQHSVTASNGDKEGTPVAILEAMAAGLPVVSTKHAGIQETIVHDETGFLVDEKDWKKMGEYMLFLYENMEKSIKIGNAARVRCQRNFSQEQHLSVVQCLIEQFIKVK
ncbi:glycosyltransferase [Riemerella anatipestifer]|uniref:glycosyltransferase n=1 Tax=Riemerella anatipestifer TaxID=34085 RepID=UPI0030C16774